MVCSLFYYPHWFLKVCSPKEWRTVDQITKQINGDPSRDVSTAMMLFVAKELLMKGLIEAKIENDELRFRLIESSSQIGIKCDAGRISENTFNLTSV